MQGGHRSVLADNYKPRAIEIYDATSAPFLDHYRLRVPRYGAILEFLNFACLLLFFVLCLSSELSMFTKFERSLKFIFLGKKLPSMSLWEVVFIIFAAAFALEEYTASKEYGWGSKFLFPLQDRHIAIFLTK